MNTSQNQAEARQNYLNGKIITPPDSDQINLLEYINVLLKNKWWITGAALLGFGLGFSVAIIKGPTWISEAVIAPRDSENNNVPNFSSLGAFGGIVASQLNISANPGLDKIDVILESRKFNAEVIEQNNLLPLIYKNAREEIYNKWYDTTKFAWKDSFPIPNLMKIGNMVKNEYLRKETKKNNTLTFRFEGKDSLFVDSLLSCYLKHLNKHIQTSVQIEAKDNVSYLENQLVMISDPLLREKLQSMIASELEKSMLVSKEAFKIIDPVYTFKMYKEKVLYPVSFLFGFIFLAILITVLTYSINANQKFKENK